MAALIGEIIMSWLYYIWNEVDHCLYNENNEVDIFDDEGNPIEFNDATTAQIYLIENDIRGDVK